MQRPLGAAVRTSCWPFTGGALLLAVCLPTSAAGLHAAVAAKSPTDPFSPYDGQSLLRVGACDAAGVEEVALALARSRCRFLSEPGELTLPLNGDCGTGFAVCPSEEAASWPVGPRVKLVADGTAGEHLRRGCAPSRPAPAPGSGQLDLARTFEEFYQNFRDYGDIEARLKGLINNSAGRAELVELSPATLDGRSLLAVRLRGENWKPGSPRALFTYTLHAREWIAAMGGVYATEKTILAVQHRPEEYRNMEIVFVPVSNPDGFVYSFQTDRFWRKNRGISGHCVGVDLNRNFDFQWGGHQWNRMGKARAPSGAAAREGLAAGALGEAASEDGPGPRPQAAGRAAQNLKGNSQDCSETYPGEAPASEPEVQALQALIEESPLTVHVDFHSFGGLILGPWSYTNKPHPRFTEIRALGVGMKEAITRSHGSRYIFCTGNSCLYPVAGAAPDYSTNSGALGFTVEMRPASPNFPSLEDFAPAASSIQPNAEENFMAMRSALKWANSTGNAAASGM